MTHKISPIQEFAAKAALGKEGLDRLKSGLCPFCGTSIHLDQFRDRQSLDEYIQSGLCQACQDDVFTG